MLVAKQDTETLFFISFIERAINSEKAYLDIVEPIIAEAVNLAIGSMKITELNRVGLDQKLKLQTFPKIKEVSANNLIAMLPEILAYFKTLI